MLTFSSINPHWGILIECQNINELLMFDSITFRKLFYDQKLIVIRGSSTTEEEFWKLCAKLGRPMTTEEYKRGRDIHVPITVDDRIEYMGKISNILSARLGVEGMPWHADNPDIDEKSYPIRNLKMVTCPNIEAGFTGFLDIEHAWKFIDSGVRDRWRTYQVEQQSWYAPGTDIRLHPSIKIHPITGVESPMVNYYNNDKTKSAWIRDVLDQYGNRLTCDPMGELIHLMERVPDCVYKHKWNENDIIMYDNHSTLHNRSHLKITNDVERLMWRINVIHDLSKPLTDNIQTL